MKKPLEGTYHDHWTYWIPETPEDVDHGIDNCEGAAMAGARPVDGLHRLYAIRSGIAGNTRTFRQLLDDNFDDTASTLPKPYVPEPLLDDETSRLLIEALKEKQ